MKKYGFQALMILVLLDLAFVLMAAVNPKVKLWGNEEHSVNFHFFSLQNMFSSDTTLVSNLKIDLLADNLITNDTLKIYKLKNNALLDSAFLALPNDTLKDTSFNCIINPNHDGVLALDNFFKALIDERNLKLIRIAHYGDSQLEGDRITSEIRKNIQAKFGGSGTGYIPIDDLASCASYSRENSDGWIRYNVFNNKFKKHNSYGISGNTFRFSSEEDESGNTHSATVSYALSKGVSYQKMTLLYGRAPNGFTVKCFNTSNNSLLCTMSIPATESTGLTTLKLTSIPSNFRLEFTSSNGPDLYGIQLDSYTGITIDNYAIRGHSGDGLLLINQNFLSKQLRETNTRLIIFEFGNNMVPYLKSEKQCEKYEDLFYKLFKKFKEAAPEASVLVIGNGDMGYRAGGVAQSYKYVRGLNTVLKNAALKSNSAFWNLLDNMGGDNSIVIWNKKGLATLDGHLTPKGQKIMSNLIFKAIMVEYNSFVLRNFYTKK